MDDQRARELLAAERARIETALRRSAIEPTDELSTVELADDASDTYQNEFDEGRAQDLRAQLAAVERAEERLRNGTYGLSVESGKRIPDERLEAGDHQRLEEIRVSLDRCWDLLRQRRAKREFGLDPDDAQARSADTVEHYEQ
jgi:RNA polymerase-binding transcription factor DksA